jgi:hypothetical protein
MSEPMEWPDLADKAHAVEQVRRLRNQAAAGGLKFEAYLPPDLAIWLLDRIERANERTSERANETLNETDFRKITLRDFAEIAPTAAPLSASDIRTLREGAHVSQALRNTST